jgi:hypothetical protein
MKHSLVFSLPLLLAAFPGNGADSFSATGWPTGVLVPGVQLLDTVKGAVNTLRVQSDDSRVAGRLQIIMDLVQQTDGTRSLSGPAYIEVGAWDAAGTTFTPTSGVWDLNARGVVQTDGSLQYEMVGEGTGGAVAGLRMEAGVQRGAGELFDMTIPAYLSGTLKPPAVNTVEVLDDFNDDSINGWTLRSKNGLGWMRETNGQFTIRGYWPGVITDSISDSWVKAIKTLPERILLDGQTLERRTDLVQMSESTTLLNSSFVGSNVTHGYTLTYSRQFVALSKWNRGFAMLCVDHASLPDQNVFLSMALTRVQTNLLITARVEEKGSRKVLFERTLWDTPAIEPTLTSNQIFAATGMRSAGWKTDVAALPWFSFDYVDLEVYQDNDGTLPEALVTFDNVELGQYDLPAISIQPAFRLSWPGNGMRFSVQGAPSPEGPWESVQDAIPPGLQQLDLPQNYPMRFFRLRQLP